MTEVIKKEKIENLIYEIRGKQVMLDRDLARLYQCSNGTKTINQAVKRHIKKFPERFMFKLTKEEYNNILRSQIGTLELEQGQYSKYLPYAFTEQGVAMLATILRTNIAEEVSIRIMDAFVLMKQYVSNNLIEQKYINNMVIKHDNEIKILQDTFKKFKPNNNHIFFEGQIYDAYSLLVDILKEAKEEIIIIDNYIDKQILDITSLLDKKITIITNKYNKIDIKKYKEQYDNLNIKINNKFHDRFIIIDRKILYHSGASFKDLGKKCFAINKIDNNEWIENLIKNI